MASNLYQDRRKLSRIVWRNSQGGAGMDIRRDGAQDVNTIHETANHGHPSVAVAI